MIRAEYIQHREKSNFIPILHSFVTENGFKGSTIQFTSYFMVWNQIIGKDWVDYYLDEVLKIYDLKFSVQIAYRYVDEEIKNNNGETVKIKREIIFSVT